MKPPQSEDHARSEPKLDEVERMAAEWSLRQAQGLSLSEENALAQWLGADERHARMFAEMEHTSRLLDGMKFQLPPAAVSPVHRPKKRAARRYFQLAAGLAAALAIGFSVWSFNRSSRIEYATSESTQLGEMKRLELPDGSVALLNTNTAVEVSYERAERRVRLLSGEAFFTVAKNPSRPFIVQAGRVAVRAVGTAFDVRLRAEAMSVLVTEGKVRVSCSAPAKSGSAAVAHEAEPLLEMGHMAQVAFDSDRAPAPEGLMVSAIEERMMKSALAWQEGRLEFFETPLAEVVAEFNRYNRHKIVIADPELAARRFGGAFASHQIEPFLELLEQSFGVVAEHRATETVIRQVR